MTTFDAAIPSPELLSRFDVPGPRYTSYPTADRFVDSVGEAHYRQALRERTRSEGAQRSLALYVHLPFCASICYYCACNKIVTRDTTRADDYLDALEHEIALHAAVLGERGGAVSQIHLGGGTPTFLDDGQLARLMAMLTSGFRIAPGAERAIEIDPRTVDAARLERLAGLGFDRLSFGVQDFDPQVQQAVHRVQPHDEVAALMAAARAQGFESINVDLIYGLPRQTRASFARTLEQVRALAPDRIALYAYAHLPERFKAQRRIATAELPAAADKTAMLQAAIRAFAEAGYDYIGMDHFARADDALASARRTGRLHRNFQGYSAQADGDLIGLGVSAIGQVGNVYAQNAKTLHDYYEALRQGRFATERGRVLDDDDRLRRAVILAVMCQGEVRYDAIEATHGIDFAQVFGTELDAVRHYADQGLVAMTPQGFRITPTGWYVVRAVAGLFDRYLRGAAVPPGPYSRIV